MALLQALRSALVRVPAEGEEDHEGMKGFGPPSMALPSSSPFFTLLSLSLHVCIPLNAEPFGREADTSSMAARRPDEHRWEGPVRCCSMHWHTRASDGPLIAAIACVGARTSCSHPVQSLTLPEAVLIALLMQAPPPARARWCISWMHARTQTWMQQFGPTRSLLTSPKQDLRSLRRCLSSQPKCRENT